MSVLVDHAASLAASPVTKPTAMVVARDPRVRAAATRRLWALGVRDVVEVATAAEARTRIGTPRDLCVVDVDLPDGSGLALLAEMRSAGWTSGLALSAVDDLCAVRAALAAGVRGYVVTGTRTTPGGAGGRVTPYRDLAGRRARQREIEVLRLVADGRSNKAIGETMGLSALTVKSHLARIARKLGTGDRAGMVAVAMRTGIIP